jgi:ABC-type glycerol-3-phosphate transport system permease component
MAARAPWMERPSMPVQIGKGLLLVFLALVMIFPFIYVFSVSFSSYKDVA